jgi:hypothetical protein
MVLDALSARAGADDTRTREQRRHDALEEVTAPPGRGGHGPGEGRAAR